MNEQDELVKEFLIESFEYLDALDGDLLLLEKKAADPDLLARIFRALHTIKGTGGFLDFSNLVGVAHAGEGLLDCLRKGTVKVNEEIASKLFELIDAIREVLGLIEETGRDGDQQYSDLVESLTRLQQARVEDAAEPEPAVKPDVSVSDSKEAEEEPEEELADGMSGYVGQMRSMLDRITTAVDDLKNDGTDEGAIQRIESSSKKIVGTTSIMGFQRLIGVMISARKALNELKNADESPAPSDWNIIKAHVAVVDSMLANIESTENEGKIDVQAAIDEHLAELSAQGSAVGISEPEPLAPAPEAPTPEKQIEPELPMPQVEVQAAPSLTGTPEPQAVPESVDKTVEEAPPPETPVQETQASEAVIQPAATPMPKEATAKGDASRAIEGSRRSLAESNIRVNVDLLDELMNLVGELVLTRNQILQYTSAETNTAIANSAQNLNLITTELQEGVMKTRMQTIGTIWKKFPRVVRDLSKQCNKQARVEMEGEDTELDKTIIEAIKDPLTHLIRNAVDHGIESPDDRVRAGKPPEGTLRLRAFHEGGHVNIEISDDGRGIDPEKIKKKALANGVVSQAAASRMSDREVFNLIFLSGLSTAREVSNISGRGVGMDVVKTYIERIGGSVDINSKLGQGTTIKIKIPLTLAIIPALIVKVKDERFALPQVNLLELVRLEGDQIETDIEMIHETPVYRLRGKLLPLVYLDQELGLDQVVDVVDESGEHTSAHDQAVINIVVLQAEDQPFGLVVNEVVDTEEVVVKPLSKLLKHVSTYAGATIMGDGKVALILDVAGLARKGGIMSHQDNHRSKSDANAHKDEAQLTTLLLARVDADRQIAIPLSMIARLEEIDPSKIEFTGRQEIVQYRGHLMPLVHLADVLHLPKRRSSEDDESLQVVVCAKNGVNVGMVVDEIVDIVDERVSLQDRAGVIKSIAIIQNKATEFLSVQEILDSVDTGIFELTEGQQLSV